MGIPVGELKRRVSSAEFAEYMVMASIEPLPSKRFELAIARLESLIANVNRDPKRRGDPYTAAEFAPDWWAERKPAKSPEEIFMQFRIWAMIANRKRAS